MNTDTSIKITHLQLGRHSVILSAVVTFLAFNNDCSSSLLKFLKESITFFQLQYTCILKALRYKVNASPVILKPL